jgi:hypothetical protein
MASMAPQSCDDALLMRSTSTNKTHTCKSSTDHRKLRKNPEAWMDGHGISRGKYLETKLGKVIF